MRLGVFSILIPIACLRNDVSTSSVRHAIAPPQKKKVFFCQTHMSLDRMRRLRKMLLDLSFIKNIVEQTVMYVVLMRDHVAVTI